MDAVNINQIFLQYFLINLGCKSQKNGAALKKILPLLILVAAFNINAQQKDSTDTGWQPTLITGLNFSQIAFSNWTKGGDNALAWTVTGNLGLTKVSAPWTFRNQLKAAYGRSKLGGNDYRTTDNDFYLESVLSYELGWAVSPFFSNSVRTQISKGYNYKVTPYVEIADFFDPGYVTQTIGFTYDKDKKIITRLGIGFQEVFTRIYNQYTDEATTADVEKFKFETGIESVTDLQLTLDDNLQYNSKLRLFSRFESMGVWDVRWDNTITAKVNSWLNVNLTYLAVYEKDQSVTLQTKEALQVGIVYTIF